MKQIEGNLIEWELFEQIVHVRCKPEKDQEKRPVVGSGASGAAFATF